MTADHPTTRDAVRATFFDIVAAIAPETEPARIDPDRALREQIDLDSFDWLKVIIGLHERLGIDIPESDYGKLRTLNAIVDYLARGAG